MYFSLGNFHTPDLGCGPFGQSSFIAYVHRHRLPVLPGLVLSTQKPKAATPPPPLGGILTLSFSIWSTFYLGGRIWDRAEDEVWDTMDRRPRKVSGSWCLVGYALTTTRGTGYKPADLGCRPDHRVLWGVKGARSFSILPWAGGEIHGPGRRHASRNNNDFGPRGS